MTKVRMDKKQRNKLYNQSEKGKAKNKERQKRYRQSEAGKLSTLHRNQRYAESEGGRAFILWTTAKTRAKLQGLPFTIKREDVRLHLERCNKTCEVTGSPLDFQRKEEVRQNPFAPSLDQKVPGIGYTPENIQIVAFWYNRMKGDMNDNAAIQILLECHSSILNKQTNKST